MSLLRDQDISGLGRVPRGRLSKVRKPAGAGNSRRNTAASSSALAAAAAAQQILGHPIPQPGLEKHDLTITSPAHQHSAEDDSSLDASADEEPGPDLPQHHQHHQHHHIHHAHTTQANEQHNLELLAAATNGASQLLSTVNPDPSIHPVLQALALHQADFTMDPSISGAQRPRHAGVSGPPASQRPHPDDELHHSFRHAHHRSAEQMAIDSGYPNLAIDSALSKRLARDPGQRLALQRREDQQLNLKRRSNVEALLALTSGQVSPVPCTNCHKGHGPWTICVVVEGQMCGSCANCWYNASGARCSFHDAAVEIRNPQSIPPPGVLANTTPFPMTPLVATQSLLQQSPSLAISYDPQIKQIIDSALASARASNTRQRHMLSIEAAAGALAVALAHYEDFLHSEEAELAQHDDSAAASASGASMVNPGLPQH